MTATAHRDNGETVQVDPKDWNNVAELADSLGMLNNNTLKIDGVVAKRSDPVPADAKVIELISSPESPVYEANPEPPERWRTDAESNEGEGNGSTEPAPPMLKPEH